MPIIQILAFLKTNFTIIVAWEYCTGICHTFLESAHLCGYIDTNKINKIKTVGVKLRLLWSTEILLYFCGPPRLWFRFCGPSWCLHQKVILLFAVIHISPHHLALATSDFAVTPVFQVSLSPPCLIWLLLSIWYWNMTKVAWFLRHPNTDNEYACIHTLWK